MAKIFLAPTRELAEQIPADATVEAEYGDFCVEGKTATLAHHGSRSNNPAPCNWPDVPVLDRDAVIVVSHVDLDTVGGVQALMGNKVNNSAFWEGAESTDVNGPHRIRSLDPDVQDKLNAFYAWSAEHRAPFTREEVLDVSDYIAEAGQALQVILDERHPEHDHMIRSGKEWAEHGMQQQEACLVKETALVREFQTDGTVFCLSAYYSPKRNEVIPCTVQWNRKTGAATLAFKDGGKTLNAKELVQQIWGPEAGGREGIAGSPRGYEVSEKEVNALVNLVEGRLLQKEIEREAGGTMTVRDAGAFQATFDNGYSVDVIPLGQKPGEEVLTLVENISDTKILAWEVLVLDKNGQQMDLNPVTEGMIGPDAPETIVRITKEVSEWTPEVIQEYIGHLEPDDWEVQSLIGQYPTAEDLQQAGYLSAEAEMLRRDMVMQEAIRQKEEQLRKEEAALRERIQKEELTKQEQMQLVEEGRGGLLEDHLDILDEDVLCAMAAQGLALHVLADSDHKSVRCAVLGYCEKHGTSLGAWCAEHGKDLPAKMQEALAKVAEKGIAL